MVMGLWWDRTNNQQKPILGWLWDYLAIVPITNKKQYWDDSGTMMGSLSTGIQGWARCTAKAQKPGQLERSVKAAAQKDLGPSVMTPDFPLWPKIIKSVSNVFSINDHRSASHFVIYRHQNRWIGSMPTWSRSMISWRQPLKMAATNL